MKPKCSVVLALVCCFLCLSSAQAQTALKNDKIPDDLLIILKRQAGWGGGSSETMITANGDFSYQTRGGLPLAVMPGNLAIKGKPEKPPKFLKPKLSKRKLRLLIAEFEKIQFFKFGNDFPQEEEKVVTHITDQATEVISIRINGQTKEVSNYLGTSLKRTKLLRDLAEKIRGAGIWNYENEKIPNNFQVSYRITDGNKIERDFRIESSGNIIKTTYTSITSVENGLDFPRFEKSKLVGKFSKQQFRKLIDELELVGFSAFTYSILSKHDGCTNEPSLNSNRRAQINVQINHVSQMYSSLYENCNPKPETNAAKFEYMKTVIEKLLKDVGINK